MRITITRKIALAVIGVAILCIATMAWVTNQNLRNGFIAYLNEVQSQELGDIGKLMVEEYRSRGSLEHLRHNRAAVRQVLERRRAQNVSERENNEQDLPPDAPPPQRDPAMPQPPERAQLPPPPGPEHRPFDPMEFGQRLSMLDQDDRPLFGPPNPPQGSRLVLTVEGRKIATLQLAPLRQLSNASDLAFLRSQSRQLIWLSAFLIVFAALVAVFLAKQMLRPIALLRNATQKIARGELKTRVTVSGRDELAELAEHVNLMAKTLQTNELQRRRMLADVSHELRTPLTVIRGEIESLLDGIRQADNAALKSLHAEALHLNKLVDDLHQLALADAGDLHYVFEPVDLRGMLMDMLPAFEQRAQSCQLRVHAHLPDSALTLNADRVRLTQLIGNLLENSLRYTDAGGQIVISLQAAGDKLELAIEDSAPGVLADSHERIFERLYKADQARSRQRGGSGLGLSICKALASAHHGSIRAMPSSLGGLKIVLRLPLHFAAL